MLIQERQMSITCIMNQKQENKRQSQQIERLAYRLKAINYIVEQNFKIIRKLKW